MALTKEQLARILLKINELSHEVADADLRPLKAAYKAFIKTLTPMLPAKENGEPYTNEELHAGAEAAKTGFQNVLDRNAESAADGDKK